MKAYKLQLDPYEVEIAGLSTDGNSENIKKRNINVKFELSRILMNPNLGGGEDKEKKFKPSREFDWMELGSICQRIGSCPDIFLTINERELEILKKRIKIVSPYFGYTNYEMFRRVLEAQNIEMVEKKD